jgi:hypothetical protein
MALTVGMLAWVPLALAIVAGAVIYAGLVWMLKILPAEDVAVASSIMARRWTAIAPRFTSRFTSRK